MALIKCPECGKEISDKATVCPNCGYPITSEPIIDSNTDGESEGKSDTMQGILSIVFGVLGIIFALIIGGSIPLISLVFFVVSIILGLKCSKNFSIIGILIAGLGIATFLKDCLLLILL